MQDKTVRILPKSRNFLGLEKKHSGYSNSDIVIVPAPCERTVSYGTGAAKGPGAILKASHYVEFWDEQFNRELCHDLGICTLQPITFGKLGPLQSMRRIQDKIKHVMADGKFAVTLGGEHTIAAATIRAHYEAFPAMSVLQFDAHSDLRQSYQGTPWSHASVMARVCEFMPPARIVQLGIRAQCIEENTFIREAGIRTFYAHAVRDGTHGEDWQQKVIDALSDEVYITFDVDYFDPSIMPATGTPEPGGFFWDETISLLIRLASARRIIGFDLVELAPMKSLPFPGFLAAKLVYKILNAAFMRR